MTSGYIQDEIVPVVRDTGCTIMNRKYVYEGQLNGEYAELQILYISMKTLPTVKICVHGPYFRGDVKTMCMPDINCNFIMGNIDRAKGPYYHSLKG